jgi:hypothetical protein
MGTKTSEHLTVGEIYARKSLAEQFGITDATINTGIFQPAGHDSVWLFITREKSPDRTQYVDELKGDDLFFEGQSAGRTDALIREHHERGLEVLLFFRERKDEHPDYGFKFEGLFEYISDKAGPPTQFHLRRVSGGGSTTVKLQLVSSVEEIQRNCRRYCQGAPSHRERARKIGVATQYWVYDVDEDNFGPAKFVGFDGMTFAKYEMANQGHSTGDKFDGHLTQNAISGLLGPFEPSKSLQERLRAHLTPEVCEGIDTGKWRFASIAASRSYFALLCNPDRFDGLGAVTALPEVAWTVNRMNPQVGDRILLWQAKGHGDRRGVIAIGEVSRGLEEEPCPDAEAGFWNEPDAGPKPRIRFKTYECPGLPLWEDMGNAWLGDLAVARATGGTVFSLEPEEWHRVAERAGVRPVAGDQVAKDKTGGQGIGLSAAERRAVELHAQGMVEEHFLSLGFVVHDVSRNHPYDLRCVRGEEEVRVEVKGTTGLGEEVFLTKNEVEHARANTERMALAIVSGIRLVRTKDGPATQGGELTLWQPWDVDAGGLQPVQFRHSPP